MAWRPPTGFPRSLALGRDADGAFRQLLKLVEIHRPLAGLVVNQTGYLSAKMKSFGLLHHLGQARAGEKSLAVQTLLRDEESDDDDEVSDSIAPTEEQDIVLRVLEDYRQLYAFAEDGVRILALHVAELGIILSGVHQFLRRYLKKTSKDWPAFHCELMVYTTSSSPMAMENRLSAWRHQVAETYRESGRPLVLSVGHRYAPTREAMIERLGQETRLYDIAFLFRFLEGQLAGATERALPFEFDFNATNIGQFPICEYPRPIRATEPARRQSLLSNRRLRIQTHHADLSARLRDPHIQHNTHLIFGHIDYTPWQPVVQALHSHAQWVACIDPFIDKQLLRADDRAERCKIVGFTSGLGDYGELNLSISTEQDTLTVLADRVHGELIELLPYQDGPALKAMAEQVVTEAEEIIGLSSLRAVVGHGEQIREVVGFAAIRRALAAPPGAMVQLLPVDSLQHWFADSTLTHRPDLLQLSLELRENDLPLVHATVIECKFALHNPAHLAHASDQVQDGLAHLTQLFAPNRDDLHGYSFDRRYWWAQLQRAMTSRAVVNLPQLVWQRLDRALESLAEGYYEIAWQGAVFTFWTNEPGEEPVLTPLAVPAGVIRAPLRSSADFVIDHIALGHAGLMRLFDTAAPLGQIDLGDAVASVRATAVRTGMVDAPEPEPEPEQLPELEPEPEPKPEPEQKPPRIEAVVTFPVVPERFLIGQRANGEPVYWHYGHDQLNNRHLLVFGSPGSGKTYAIQCLLAEMAAQHLHSLIVDYTDGFAPGQVEPEFAEGANPKDYFICNDPLPLNPFRQQVRVIDPSKPAAPENAYQAAMRVGSIFCSVYDTIGEQQRAVLLRVLEAGIAEQRFSTLEQLMAGLRADSQYGETLASKLELFAKINPFDLTAEEPWSKMLADPAHWVQILQLRGLSLEIQRLITEFILWDLYDFAMNTGNKRRPIPVVLDEIQNLDHSDGSPIDKLIREGRKFGLSMILATQTTSNFNQEQRDRLFLADHKLFFKPADTEVDKLSTLLGQNTPITKSDWAQRLSKLGKGECWSVGGVQTSSGALETKPLLVKVTALKDRGFASE